MLGSRFREHTLMLDIAEDQRSLARSPADHEWGAQETILMPSDAFQLNACSAPRESSSKAATPAVR